MQTKPKVLALAIFVFLLASAVLVYAAPSGPIVTLISNETKSAAPATKINTTGGSITIMRLNATTQNPRWKAYVGNVTGTLTLDDANDNSIFQWSLTAVTGEVYATRASGNINWSGVNCSNLSHIALEEAALNHTNKDDNITSTFSSQLHNSFYIGTKQIFSNTCFSVHTFVNSSSQSARFEEVAL